MTNPNYSKRAIDDPIWEGPRGVRGVDLSMLSDFAKEQVEFILDVMDWPKLLVFRYGNSDRVVAPFVVGVSSENNPLLRGFQMEGLSRSGKGAGWRVFQVEKMVDLEDHQDFFNPEDFDFDRYYPWIYKVFKML